MCARSSPVQFILLSEHLFSAVEEEELACDISFSEPGQRPVIVLPFAQELLHYGYGVKW
jgi:hypothetical protein